MVGLGWLYDYAPLGRALYDELMGDRSNRDPVSVGRLRESIDGSGQESMHSWSFSY